MDNLHKPPMLSVRLHVDSANPLVYWCLGLFGFAAALMLLALL